MKIKTVLAIAGSDSSGGAGIQADLKTMIMNGVYGMSAVTALTAQNTQGVDAVMESTPGFLEKQIDAVFRDIPPDAVKIGMVASSELISVIASCLNKYSARCIVVDPVMVSTSGSRLLKPDAVEILKKELIPLADLITPNIPETEVLTGISIKTRDDMSRAAEMLGTQYGCAVLCKGGHSIPDADDLLYNEGRMNWYYGERIANPNTHGTGCTLSSAIAANLAKGMVLEKAVSEAKAYISGALRAMLDLGKGSGPIDHAFCSTGRFSER